MSDDENISKADKLALSDTTKQSVKLKSTQTNAVHRQKNMPTNSDEHQENALESSASEVSSRLTNGCICQGNCYKNLQADAVYRHRLNIAELTKQEHDMYLMGVTMASLADRSSTNRNKERLRQRATYVFQGKRVCLDAFLYLENVTQYHLKRIRRHVMAHGVVPRVHGNVRKKPHNALPLDFYKYAENYVKTELLHNKNDATRNYVVNVLRMNCFQSFRQRCVEENKPTMSYSTFRHFMKRQFPNVRFRTADEKSKANKRRRVQEHLAESIECVVEQAKVNDSTDDDGPMQLNENASDNENEEEYCIEYIEHYESDLSDSNYQDGDENELGNKEYILL